MEYFQHSAINAHPEHLICYIVIVCYYIPLDLQRVVKGFHKTLWEQRRSRVQIGLLLLDRESRLVLSRHVKTIVNNTCVMVKLSKQVRVSSLLSGNFLFTI